VSASTKLEPGGMATDFLTGGGAASRRVMLVFELGVLRLMEDS
jgi:hypothetical protein